MFNISNIMISVTSTSYYPGYKYCLGTFLFLWTIRKTNGFAVQQCGGVVKYSIMQSRLLAAEGVYGSWSLKHHRVYIWRREVKGKFELNLFLPSAVSLWHWDLSYIVLEELSEQGKIHPMIGFICTMPTNQGSWIISWIKDPLETDSDSAYWHQNSKQTTDTHQRAGQQTCVHMGTWYVTDVALQISVDRLLSQ